MVNVSRLSAECDNLDFRPNKRFAMRKEANLCLSVLLLGSTLAAQSPASSVPPSNAWLKAGGNLSLQPEFLAADTDQPQNVTNLKAVWHTRLDGSGVGAKSP